MRIVIFLYVLARIDPAKYSPCLVGSWSLTISSSYALYSIKTLRFLDQTPMTITIVQTIMKCPSCRTTETVTMDPKTPGDFFTCKECKQTHEPRLGDCCVYCSYGSVNCPAVQEIILRMARWFQLIKLRLPTISNSLMLSIQRLNIRGLSA